MNLPVSALNRFEVRGRKKECKFMLTIGEEQVGDMAVEWKKLELNHSEVKSTGQSIESNVSGCEAVRERRKAPVSDYLVACEEGELIEYQKQLLFDVLGPVFFGKKQAGNREELAQLFCVRYGIDVQKDFCEGDEHFEEFREAQEAIAEGLCIYGGQIAFGDCVLAEIAGTIWEDLEKQDKHKFRRINTMLEE